MHQVRHSFGFLVGEKSTELFSDKHFIDLRVGDGSDPDDSGIVHLDGFPKDYRRENIDQVYVDAVNKRREGLKAVNVSVFQCFKAVFCRNSTQPG